MLVAAGVASFLVAVLLQGAWGHGQADVVMPASRDQRSIQGETPLVALVNLSPAENKQTSTFRMNRTVVRDPFGPLAPEVALAPIPPPIPVPAVDPAKSKSKRKVVPVGASGPPVPPPAPVAPPLPFTAVGFIQGSRIGNGQQQTFIQHGENLTLIRQGETINNVYRVDDINAERVLFTYLPLGQKQTMSLLDKTK
ncbi:MAG: hypothetical protein Q8K71_17490 [Polaromonas sp.]|nr:hypothetical protein [Polaromonas sp.]